MDEQGNIISDMVRSQIPDLVLVSDDEVSASVTDEEDEEGGRRLLGASERAVARGAVKNWLRHFRVPPQPARKACCPCEAGGPPHRNRDRYDGGRAARDRWVGVSGRVRWMDRLGRRENGNEERQSSSCGRHQM